MQYSSTGGEVRPGENLALDESGRLYDRRFREKVSSSRFYSEEHDLRSIEALGALRAASHAVHVLMERWGDRHGMSEGRLHLLFNLFRAPQRQLPLGELAGLLEVSPRNVTGLVDHLERDGLVERVPDPADRRSIQARLTAVGLGKIEALWREAIQAQIPVLRGFSAEDLGQLRHLCLRLVQCVVETRTAAARAGQR